MSISLVMIVKNEERTLPHCLPNLTPLVDEVIILDTGSSDGTIEYARQFTDYVYQSEWINTGACRTIADSYATSDYILTWDADLSLKPDELTKFKSLVSNLNPKVNGYEMNWIIEAQGDSILKAAPRVMLYKRKQWKWKYPVHAQISYLGTKARIQSTNIFITHSKEEVKSPQRTAQTILAMSTYLSEHPDDTYLRFLEVEGKMQLGDTHGALESLIIYLNSPHIAQEPVWKVCAAMEYLLGLAFKTGNQEVFEMFQTKFKRLLESSKRGILCIADYMTIVRSPEAVTKYELYLKDPRPIEGGYYDYERYTVHPHLMLGNLFLKQNKPAQARKHIKSVIKLTKLHKTKERGIIILQSMV